MKLTIERAALLTSLQHVQSVVKRRNTIPILSNILLAADDAEQLADAYRRARLQAEVQRRLDAIVADRDDGAVEVPDDLVARVAIHLQEHTALTWDQAVKAISAKGSE